MIGTGTLALCIGVGVLMFVLFGGLIAGAVVIGIGYGIVKPIAKGL